jgi:hypothetical protein
LVSSHYRDGDRDTFDSNDKGHQIQPEIEGVPESRTHRLGNRQFPSLSSADIERALEECIHDVPGGCWLCKKYGNDQGTGLEQIH